MACSGTRPNLIASTWADVADCHDYVALDGDTITVMSGNYTVSGTAYTAITKYVKVICAGNRTCVVTNDTAAGEGATDLISFTESPAGNSRLEGFRFIQGTGIHSGTSAIVSLLYNNGGKPVLIYNNKFELGSSGNSIRATTNRGVIRGNEAVGAYYSNGSNCLNNTSFLRHKPSGLTTSWSTPSTFGSADVNGDANLYVEGNIISHMAEAWDSDDNARDVYRYNTLTNAGYTAHGESAYGNRHSEFYGNAWILDSAPRPECGGGTLPAQLNGWMEPRNGTAIIVNNLIPDCCGPTWGVKPEIRIGIQILRRNHGQYGCWSTLNFPGAGYPAPRQAGWGYIAGATNPGASGATQDLEPLYIANNAGLGNYDSISIEDYGPDECGGGPAVSGYIQADREFYQQVAHVSFDGSTGASQGTRAQMDAITPKKPGIGFWVTDEGSWNTENDKPGTPGFQKGHGQLYRANTALQWELHYTPFPYPHPLVSGGTLPPIKPPVEPPVEPPPTEPPVEPPPVVEPPTEPIPPPTTSHPGKKKGHKKNSG